jgi:uncharacterized protein with HEPN domain
VSDEARLADILERIERIDRIERATAGGREELHSSEVIQDAVIRNLEVIGEAAKAISVRTRRRYPGIPWREMARFRDLATHQYGRVLADEVWSILQRDLAQIRHQITSRLPSSRTGSPGR